MDTNGRVDHDEKDDGDDSSEDVAEPEDVVIDVSRIISQSCYSVVKIPFSINLVVKIFGFEEFWDIYQN